MYYTVCISTHTHTRTRRVYYYIIIARKSHTIILSVGTRVGGGRVCVNVQVQYAPRPRLCSARARALRCTFFRCIIIIKLCAIHASSLVCTERAQDKMYMPKANLLKYRTTDNHPAGDLGFFFRCI